MVIRANDEKIRYTGRWNVTEQAVVSTANGNYFEFVFEGTYAALAFDISQCELPYPHVYICVDDGAMVASPLDNYMRISCGEGRHHVKVIMKCSWEYQRRWVEPNCKVVFVGAEAPDFVQIGEDTRPKIEFIGDSITEGNCLEDIRELKMPDTAFVNNNDATASYAWLTANALDFRLYTMGYGGTSVTCVGNGGMPPVAQSYGYYSNGCPMESVDADYVVINHGTNDCRGEHADKELFIREYAAFLKLVRSRNPKAKIVSLTPFSGWLEQEVVQAVKLYNDQSGDNVRCIVSTGWIPPSPLHPTREGHRIVSEHLVKIFKNEII